MVLKTDTCSFSGLRIYPGHGQKLIRLDGKPYFFLSSKAKALFYQRRKPQTVAWTVYYRRVMKKARRRASRGSCWHAAEV
jgi:large subunit ribosomal protein L24e